MHQSTLPDRAVRQTGADSGNRVSQSHSGASPGPPPSGTSRHHLHRNLHQCRAVPARSMEALSSPQFPCLGETWQDLHTCHHGPLGVMPPHLIVAGCLRPSGTGTRCLESCQAIRTGTRGQIIRVSHTSLIRITPVGHLAAVLAARLAAASTYKGPTHSFNAIHNNFHDCPSWHTLVDRHRSTVSPRSAGGLSTMSRRLACACLFLATIYAVVSLVP